MDFDYLKRVANSNSFNHTHICLLKRLIIFYQELRGWSQPALKSVVRSSTVETLSAVRSQNRGDKRQKSPAEHLSQLLSQSLREDSHLLLMTRFVMAPVGGGFPPGSNS